MRDKNSNMESGFDAPELPPMPLKNFQPVAYQIAEPGSPADVGEISRTLMEYEEAHSIERVNTPRLSYWLIIVQPTALDLCERMNWTLTAYR